MSRPWITPNELVQFTEHEGVKNKSPTRMDVMISLAESKIIAYCKHDFSDEEKYPELPEEVKNATLILADALCYNDSLRTSGKLKSESYDDYSYSVDVTETSTDFDILGITSLLDPFVLDDSGNLFMRVSVL